MLTTQETSRMSPIVDRWDRPAPFEDHWHGGRVFLVLGGPSMNALDLSLLKQRGVVSFGVNNVTAHVRTDLWTFGDKVSKFHDAIWFDPGVVKFVPYPKMSYGAKHFIRTKASPTEFLNTEKGPRDCQNVWGIKRNSKFQIEQWLWEDTINWGHSKKHLKELDQPTVLNTMFQAVRLCYYLGFRTVYLVGADFTMSEDYKYVFDELRTEGAVRGNNSAYTKLDWYFRQLRPWFEDAGFTILNCLGKETRFVTQNGVKSFCDFSNGDITRVLTHTGQYRQAVVRCYGKQALLRIGFQRSGGGSGRKRYYVRATASHRWLLRDRQWTANLKVGDYLIAPPTPLAKWDYEDCIPLERLAWCYGYVFGDGGVQRQRSGNIYSYVRLCKKDRSLVERFKDCGFTTSVNSMSCGGDPFAYTSSYAKEPMKPGDDLAAIRGFVAGWLDADGNQVCNNRPRWTQITTSGEKHLRALRELFPLAGAYVLTETDVSDVITHLGPRKQCSSRFHLLTKMTDSAHSPFRVVSIEESAEEEVWCLEVDKDHSIVLKNGIVTGNCNSESRLTAFDHIDYESAVKDSIRENKIPSPIDTFGWYQGFGDDMEED